MRQKNSNNNGDNISNSVSAFDDSSRTEVFPFRYLKTKTNLPVSTEARIWQEERKTERTSKKWLMYFYRFRAMRGNRRATRMHSHSQTQTSMHCARECALLAHLRSAYYDCRSVFEILVRIAHHKARTHQG